MKFVGIPILKLLVFINVSLHCLAVVDEDPTEGDEKLQTVNLKPVSTTGSWTRYARRLAYFERSFKCCLLGRTAAKIGYFCDFDVQARYLRINDDHFHRVKTEVWRQTPRLMTNRVFRQCRKHSNRYRKCCEDESEYIDRFIAEKSWETKSPKFTKAQPTNSPTARHKSTTNQVSIIIHPHESRTDKEP